MYKKTLIILFTTFILTTGCKNFEFDPKTSMFKWTLQNNKKVEKSE
jgi:hypothetical protein